MPLLPEVEGLSTPMSESNVESRISYIFPPRLSCTTPNVYIVSTTSIACDTCGGGGGGGGSMNADTFIGEGGGSMDGGTCGRGLVDGDTCGGEGGGLVDDDTCGGGGGG
jgi:hypothetical protein